MLKIGDVSWMTCGQNIYYADQEKDVVLEGIVIRINRVLSEGNFILTEMNTGKAQKTQMGIDLNMAIPEQPRWFLHLAEAQRYLAIMKGSFGPHEVFLVSELHDEVNKPVSVYFLSQDASNEVMRLRENGQSAHYEPLPLNKVRMANWTVEVEPGVWEYKAEIRGRLIHKWEIGKTLWSTTLPAYNADNAIMHAKENLTAAMKLRSIMG